VTPGNPHHDRTSVTDPLRISAVETPGGGRIGMTLCPGKQQAGAMNGTWARDLALDLAVIRDWGATAVLTLMEPDELQRYGAADIGAAVRKLGMEWYNTPIPDVHAPGTAFEALWPDIGMRLRQHLLAARPVLLHCLGGLGRTGTIAARLLAELGVPPAEAVRQVRKARPGAIETVAQENHVLSIQVVAIDGLGTRTDREVPATN
jgi:ADP-ribosyl-[dinitrogen reductase] hydrolase